MSAAEDTTEGRPKEGPVSEDRLESNVDQLYRHRFPPEILERRREVWKVICSEWFSRYIPADSRVLEVASGYCEFINNIKASSKFAIDLNPETKEHAGEDVEFHLIGAERLDEAIGAGSVDRVFMSNFLEHCRDRDQVLAVLKACYRVLAPGGKVLILGPNFRYIYEAYFDFFDHHVALTELSVGEGLLIAGFELELSLDRTLPYNFRSRLPSWPWLVRLYLHMPFAWRFFGKQFFVIGRKEGTSASPSCATG